MVNEAFEKQPRKIRHRTPGVTPFMEPLGINMLRIMLFIYLLVFTLTLRAQENRVEIWNHDKTASASCIENKFPTCQVVLNGKFIDVTPVTYLNIGKLGTLKVIEYEKVITEPFEWVKNTGNIQIVNFRTQAWRDGKKYTITEPVLISNGKYIRR